MKNISIQDCYNLKKKFDKYTKTAEQHQFVQLAMIETMFNRTLKHYEKVGSVDNQKEANSMFRVISKIIEEGE